MDIITSDTVQQIRDYSGPSWLVAPDGEPEYDDVIRVINAALQDGEATVVERDVMGWGPYNAIVAHDDRHYLVGLAS